MIRAVFTALFSLKKMPVKFIHNSFGTFSFSFEPIINVLINFFFKNIFPGIYCLFLRIQFQKNINYRFFFNFRIDDTQSSSKFRYKFVFYNTVYATNQFPFFDRFVENEFRKDIFIFKSS